MLYYYNQIKGNRTGQNNKKIGGIMDKNYKSFFASAMIFSVLASGCSDSGNSSESSEIIQTTTETSITTTTDEESSEENSSEDDKETKAVQLSANASAYECNLEDIFSENDLNPVYSSENQIILKNDKIELKGKGNVNNSDVLITEGGAYKITGTLDDGQIIVNSDEKVWLILDNANISCSDSSPVYIEKSDKTFITLAPDSENTLSDGKEYSYTSESENEPDAVIFSKDNLTVNGTGTLNINANFNEGITSKDDLTITGGTININSVGNGIKGKDCVAVSSAEINITSQADGIKSSNADEKGKGFIFISGGTFNINSMEDAFQSEQEFIIDGGNINIISGEGSSSEYVKQHTDSMMGGHGGFGRFSPQSTETETETETTISRKGIKSGANMYINGGNITADCSSDSIHSNSDITISGGKLELSSGSQTIHADNTLSVKNGSIDILKSYEGLEASVIDISGGDISIISDDDGFNASDGSTQGAMGQNTDGVAVKISGGTIYINAEGDGLDSNGTMTISGGNVTVDGPSKGGNGALDSNNGISLEGGILIAVGSNDMAEYPDTDSKQKFLAMTADADSEFAFKVCLENSAIAEYKPQKNYSGSVSIIVSTPDLAENNEYTLYINDIESGSYKVNETPAGSGFGGGRGGFNKTPREDFDPENMTPPDDFDPENMTPPDGFNKRNPMNGEMPEMPSGFSNEQLT